MKKRLPKVSKSFQPPQNGHREIVLAGYVTPSLNTMLGRNHWILTKLKAEARQALVIGLRSHDTGLNCSTSTMESVVASP
jgi:hypothetical protein